MLHVGALSGNCSSEELRIQKMQLSSLPENSYHLLSWRAAELIIDSMFKNPNNHTHNKKEQPCNTPHLQSKWLQECPGCCYMPFNRSQDNQSCFNERLGEISIYCALHCNCDIPYSSIKLLQNKITLVSMV